MFILRSAKLTDLNDLYNLSQQMISINLPENKSLIKERIISSTKSFKNPSKDLSKNNYIFVLEDINKKKVIGTSMISGRHGTKSKPHFSLKIIKEEKYSKTLKIKFTYKKLKLKIETNGWSEIGGLILDPKYRGHKSKIGKQLSFVRFLYMGINKKYFTNTIHTELMPPLSKKGNPVLWESIGKKFLGMEYNEADELSRKNKEFIISLFPNGTIYETFLPEDARNSIGKVGPFTIPVKKMLEKIGFKYTNEVDPFDGGPHYRSKLKDINIIKNIIKVKVKGIKNKKSKLIPIIISLPTKKGEFKASFINASINKKNKYVYLNNDFVKIHNIKYNQEMYITTL